MHARKVNIRRNACGARHLHRAARKALKYGRSLKGQLRLPFL
jgi:hypothetical protein